MQRPCVLLTLLAGSLCPSACFYLPGVAPREYVYGERVELKVNKLTSTVTQVCQRTDAAMRCTQRPRSVAAPDSMAA